MSAKRVAFVMDPLTTVKAYKDTTYYLMLATQKLGHQVFYLDQRDLSLEGNRLSGRLSAVTVHEDTARPFTVDEPRWMAMADMDVVMVRTDPPFDRTYFYTTLLLDYLPPTTRVVNRPSGLRNWNEKLAAHFFADYMPATLVTERAEQIRAFMERHDRITLKPIDGHGGKGIFFLEPGDGNADAIIDTITHRGRHRVIAQQYVTEAKAGDKRILLLDGEPLGAILRLHAEGKELNNLDAGGSANPATLNERDLEICRALGPGLREQGVRFCGIDVLGDKLIEVNVTSPTGLQEMCRFDGRDYHLEIMAALTAD
jgi:glutathione synthase